MYDNKNQNTLEWFRQRLGNITGSAVGNLMVKPRAKGETWSQTALSYLNQVAFERAMNPLVVENDDLFAQYVALNEVKRKAITWGHAMEGEAAHLFAVMFKSLYGSTNHAPYELELIEPSSVVCKDLSHFASSPDRMFFNPETGEECAVEIKCPQGQSFAKFVNGVFLQSSHESQLEGLKKSDGNYYWQCYAHMLATGATKTYFVVYNPFMQKPIFALEIARDEAVIDELRAKICAGNAYVDELAGRITGKTRVEVDGRVIRP